MATLAHALVAGTTTTLGFFWDSLYGLVFGFLISGVVQTVFSRGAMQRALGPNLRGIASGMGFGIVASACSYGAAAAARGFFRKGADLRSVFAFMISSTNMNLAILVMFWSLVGWRFAFAEFFGGIVIIAVVCAGVTLLFRPEELAGLAASMPTGPKPARVAQCLQCGMTGWNEHAVAYDGTTYLFCGSKHETAFRSDPAGVLAATADDAGGDGEAAAMGVAALTSAKTWTAVLETALGDLAMLRSELVIGFVIAGFAAALVPQAWLAWALHGIGGVPFVGYALLLLAGLLLAAATFICSMGNVPIARYLAAAGVPLGANTTFIYGDLLIAPLVGIYRKSFPAKAVWSFLGLFVIGAMLAGWLTDLVIGGLFGAGARQADTMHMGAMLFSDRFTLAANLVAIAAAAAVVVAARRGAVTSDAHSDHAHGEHAHDEHSHGDGAHHDHAHAVDADDAVREPDGARVVADGITARRE